MSKITFDFTDRDIDCAQTRLAHLTGICPKCGDAGWWIDDGGHHDCDCKAEKLALGDRAHDGMNPGEIIAVDEARGLYLLEYELWPGEPLRSKWCKAEELRRPLPVVELARS